jgi:SNF family Na+-dependent transporter
MKEGADQATSVENLWNKEFFYNDTLHTSDGIMSPGSLIGPLVGCLVLSYIVTYFSAWKGLKSTGKMVYVSCLLPYLILTILLIKGFTLEGCGLGLKYLFLPDWSKLGDISVWVAAAKQILFSSGVSYGPLMYYGSARGRDDKLLRVSYMIPILNSATSFYAALTIFTFLGHVSTMKGIPVADLSQSGPDLLFVAFPALLGLLAGKNFWAVIFFIMCVCLGVDSVFGFVDFYVQYAEDSIPIIRQKVRKEVSCLIVIIFSFLWSLMFVNEGGLYTFLMFDDYSGGIQLLACVLCELAFIPWIFGMDKLSILMEARTGEKMPAFVKIFIKFVIPVFIFAVFILAWISEFSADSAESRAEKGWTVGITWLGRMIWFLPLLFMIAGFFFPQAASGSPDVYDLIEEQYGIRFNKDGSNSKVSNLSVKEEHEPDSKPNQLEAV